jgi:hypothetical protein
MHRNNHLENLKEGILLIHALPYDVQKKLLDIAEEAAEFAYHDGICEGLRQANEVVKSAREGMGV